MWKRFSFGNGGIQCLFVLSGQKCSKKFGGIKNIAYFCA